MRERDFIDSCVYIATRHPRSRVNNFSNDVCVKAGIESFANACEYRDEYILISSAINDSAVYVEALQPIGKILVLIDGRGNIATFDYDYQYLSEYVRVIASQII